MLAQNFMTADQLRINEDQHEGLLKVLKQLETGKLDKKFNMNYWFRVFSFEKECGTTACIGGWANSLMGRNVFENPAWLKSHYDERLKDLLFPDNEMLFSKNTSKGAHALRNYLTRGDADWPGVMAKRR